MKLSVNETFYSLQGEGGRVGEASVFIRLAKCNLSCSFCDTDFEHGDDMDVDEILQAISVYPTRWIIWTGGEPTLQLTDAILARFKAAGYHQAIETNGLIKVPSLIDYVTCSPKANFKKVKENNPQVDEIRMPLRKGDPLPDIESLPVAKKYFISPIFDENKLNDENVIYCVGLVLQHPQWILSLQTHKLINIE